MHKSLQNIFKSAQIKTERRTAQNGDKRKIKKTITEINIVSVKINLPEKERGCADVSTKINSD